MRAKIILILTVLLITGICIGSAGRDNPKTLRARIEVLEMQVNNLTDRLTRVEAKVVPPLAAVPADIERLRAPLVVGKQFYFGDSDSAVVSKVIDELNSLVELHFRVPQTEVIQYNLRPSVTNDTWAAAKETVWLRGVITENLVDGQKISFQPHQIFQVSGTQNYNTPIGAKRTVFLIEAVTPNPVPEILSQKEKIYRRPRPLPAREVRLHSFVPGGRLDISKQNKTKERE